MGQSAGLEYASVVLAQRSRGQESDAQKETHEDTEEAGKVGGEGLKVKVDLRGAPSVDRCLFASLKTFPRRDLNPGLVGENHIS